MKKCCRNCKWIDLVIQCDEYGDGKHLSPICTVKKGIRITVPKYTDYDDSCEYWEEFIPELPDNKGGEKG